MSAADEAYDRLHGVDGHAQAPARALREAAQFFEREMSRAWGGDTQWLTTGTRIAELVADVLRDHAADLDSEGVGTGAGEGATGQDTGTAWVTRSADCPEAPAQAHPLGPDGFTRLAGDTPRYTSGETLCRNRHGLAHPQGPCWACDADARLEAAEERLGRVAGLLAAYGDAEGTPVDYEFLVHHISEAIK